MNLYLILIIQNKKKLKYQLKVIILIINLFYKLKLILQY